MATIPEGFQIEKQAPQGIPEGFTIEPQQPQEEALTTSAPRTVLEQGLQVATFGYADEAEARIAARFAQAFGGEATANIPYDELVNMALENQRELIQTQQEERPILSLVSGVGGALFTGGAGASTKVGKALAGKVAASNLPARVAAGAAAGATAGGAFGLGTAEGELEDRLKGGAEGAALGAVTGGVMPTIAPAFKYIAPKFKDGAQAAKRAIARHKINTATPLNSETIKGFSSKAYDDAAKLGGVLDENFTNSVIAKAKKIAPQTKAGRLLEGDSALSKIINNLDELEGQPLNLQSADEIDKFLTKTREGLLNVGKETSASREIGKLQDVFRDSIEAATEKNIVGGKEGFDTLKKARKLWSTQSKMRDIENIIEFSQDTANPRQSMKTAFNTLRKNPKRFNRFTKPEQALIRKAAKSGIVSGVLNTLGSSLIPIGAAVTGGGGGIIGGIVAATPAFALSLAARKAAQKLQTKKATDVLRKIQQGAFN